MSNYNLNPNNFSLVEGMTTSPEQQTQQRLEQISNDLNSSSKLSVTQLESDRDYLENKISILNAKLQKGGSTDDVQQAHQELQNTKSQLMQIIDNQLATVASINKGTSSLSATSSQLQDGITSAEATNKMLNMNIKQLQQNVATRQRMLQVTEDSNVYKMKVIYTLLAIILCIIVLMLALYSSTK